MPTKAKKAVKGSSVAARLSKTYGVELPPRLVRFFDEERKEYEGRFIFGMNGFGAAVKMPLRIAAAELQEHADYATRVTGIKVKQCFPLAAAGKHGGTYFVAVDLTKPQLPVLFYDYESGFSPYAPDLETFLETGLLKKGQPAPLEELAALYEKANKLHDKKKYAQSEALLLTGLWAIPETTPRTFDEFMEVPGAFMNLLGLCREDLKKTAEAMKAYEHATRLGSDVAGLNVCRYLKDRKDHKKLISYAEAMRERIVAGLSDYSWFWVRNYLGQAYLAIGDSGKAVLAYHEIKKNLEVDNADKIRTAAESLRALAKKKARGAAEILQWFDPPAAPLIKDEKERLRAFWGKVPKDVRERLLAAVNAEKESNTKPSVDVLSRIANLTRLKLDHLKLGNAEFLRDLPKLQSLSLDNGQLTSLDAIATLTKLESLSLTNAGITNLIPLSGLTRLQTLWCSENKLSSLEGLSSMHRLTYLHAADVGISDLGPLSGLLELESLTVYNNPIADLSPLATCKRLKEISSFGVARPLRGLLSLKKLPRLEKVNTTECPKADVAAMYKARPDLELDLGIDNTEPKRVAYSKKDLSDLRKFWMNRSGLGKTWVKKLNELLAGTVFDDHDPQKLTDKQLMALFGEASIWVDGLDLENLAPLGHFRSADFLDASANRIASLEPLTGHSWLETLRVNKNAITSLVPLGKAQRLEALHCDQNCLTSLAGLEKVSSLRTLHADENQLADLSALRELTELRELSVVSNRITSLKPLAKLDKLVELCAYDNAFTDLSPLAGCKRLQVVECFGNAGLKNVMDLKDLPELRQVISHGALSNAEIKTFLRARPDVQID